MKRKTKITNGIKAQDFLNFTKIWKLLSYLETWSPFQDTHYELVHVMFSVFIPKVNSAHLSSPSLELRRKTWCPYSS